MRETEKIWMNGELVEAVREQGFDDARVIRLGAASG